VERVIYFLNVFSAGPVLRIKQGIAMLRIDCIQMEVRIGVLQHSLMRVQYHLKMYQLLDDE